MAVQFGLLHLHSGTVGRDSSTFSELPSAWGRLRAPQVIYQDEWRGGAGNLAPAQAVESDSGPNRYGSFVGTTPAVAELMALTSAPISLPSKPVSWNGLAGGGVREPEVSAGKIDESYVLRRKVGREKVSGRILTGFNLGRQTINQVVGYNVVRCEISVDGRESDTGAGAG